MTLGGPIGSGVTAEVYAWDEGQVLKLFRNWVRVDQVDYEARAVRAVHAAGLPVPAVGEQLEVDGRIGLVYERVDGPTLHQYLDAKPWTLFRCARIMAGLHAGLHANHKAPGLRPLREKLESRLRAGSARGLPADLQEAALKALDAMPDGDSMCHGDFHAGNILMTARGPIIIDWDGASIGDPLADVATTLLLKDEVLARPSIPWLVKLRVGRFYPSYLKRYFRLRPADVRKVVAWTPVLAAARFEEVVPETGDWLLSLVRQGLIS